MSEERHSGSYKPATHPRIDAILSEVPRDAAVLDIGCVQHDLTHVDESSWLHGRLHRHVSSKGRLVGLDYLKKEVEKLQDRGFNVVQGNAEKFDLKDKFDIIIAGELIEHLSNPGKFLERAQAHLAAGGKLIITTPNPWWIGRFLKAILLEDVTVNPEHTCYFDIRTLSQLTERYGFTIVQTRTIQDRRVSPFRHKLNILWAISNVTRPANRLLGSRQFMIVATSS